MDVEVTVRGITGLVDLGEARQRVRERLGEHRPVAGSLTTLPQDVFECGVTASYDDADRVCVLEVREPVVASFERVQLTGRTERQFPGFAWRGTIRGTNVFMHTDEVPAPSRDDAPITSVSVGTPLLPDLGYWYREEGTRWPSPYPTPENPWGGDVAARQVVALAVQALLGRQPRHAWAVDLMVGIDGVAFVFQLSQIDADDLADVEAVLSRFVELTGGIVGVQRRLEVCEWAVRDDLPKVRLYWAHESTSPQIGIGPHGEELRERPDPRRLWPVRRLWEPWFVPTAPGGVDRLRGPRDDAECWLTWVVVAAVVELDTLVPLSVSAIGVEVDGWKVVVHVVGVVRGEWDVADDLSEVDDLMDIVFYLECRLDEMTADVDYDVFASEADAPASTTWIYRRHPDAAAREWHRRQ